MSLWGPPASVDPQRTWSRPALWPTHLVISRMGSGKPQAAEAPCVDTGHCQSCGAGRSEDNGPCYVLWGMSHTFLHLGTADAWGLSCALSVWSSVPGALP